jgi:hypothetical protein
MSTPAEAPATMKVCPHCGAAVAADAAKCWLCYGPLGGRREVVMAEAVTAEAVKPAVRRPSPLTEGFFLVLTLVCLLLIVLVGIGIAQDDPGLLIPYLIFLSPALLATVSRALISHSRGNRVTAMEVFLTFLVSASATILLVMVLFFAAIVAFFIYCLYVCGQM